MRLLYPFVVILASVFASLRLTLDPGEGVAVGQLKISGG